MSSMAVISDSASFRQMVKPEVTKLSFASTQVNETSSLTNVFVKDLRFFLRRDSAPRVYAPSCQDATCEEI